MQRTGRVGAMPTLAVGMMLGALLIVAGCDHSSGDPASSAATTKQAAPATAQATSAEKPADKATANATPTAPTASATPAAAQATETPPAVTAATARPAVPGRPRDVTFDTIKFGIEKDQKFFREMLTPEIEKLFGQPIRIRGFIYPTFQQTGIKTFVLVRDNQECCFGPGAALFDCIVVDMKPGKTTDYSIRPVTVEGIFGFSELKDPDGIQRAIFHLDGESVR
ncbi:MAG: hypothetical protein K2Y37_18660 [Pirellulales bacterium]|nr:hypothetical protein [Pirellulales bacterium]